MKEHYKGNVVLTAPTLRVCVSWCVSGCVRWVAPLHLCMFFGSSYYLLKENEIYRCRADTIWLFVHIVFITPEFSAESVVGRADTPKERRS